MDFTRLDGVYDTTHNLLDIENCYQGSLEYLGKNLMSFDVPLSRDALAQFAYGIMS